MATADRPDVEMRTTRTTGGVAYDCPARSVSVSLQAISNIAHRPTCLHETAESRCSEQERNAESATKLRYVCCNHIGSEACSALQ